jgi:DNA polymerase III subunit gamma/tau
MMTTADTAVAATMTEPQPTDAARRRPSGRPPTAQVAKTVAAGLTAAAVLGLTASYGWSARTTQNDGASVAVPPATIPPATTAPAPTAATPTAAPTPTAAATPTGGLVPVAPPSAPAPVAVPAPPGAAPATPVARSAGS